VLWSSSSGAAEPLCFARNESCAWTSDEGILGMTILWIASIVASLAIAIWPLVVLRRWGRSPRGQETLRGWRPAVVVPAQAAVALLWLVMLFGLQWTVYALYQLAGDLWYVPAKLAITTVFILVPGGVIIFDASWFHLHRIPRQWTLGRIWGMAALLLLASAMLAATSISTAISVGGVVLQIFSVLSAIFLTAWWIASHPVVAN